MDCLRPHSTAGDGSIIILSHTPESIARKKSLEAAAEAAEWIEVFQKAGISVEDLKDTRIAAKILSVIHESRPPGQGSNVIIDLASVTPEWKEIFRAAGVKPKHLRDPSMVRAITEALAADGLSMGPAAQQPAKLPPRIPPKPSAAIASAAVASALPSPRKPVPKPPLPSLAVPISQLAESTNNFDGKLEIGRGSFGQVYRGDLCGTPIAVKKLDAQPDAVESFETEVRMLSKYRHPNIVQLIAYSNDDPRSPCVVYELMEGGSLADALILCRRRKSMIHAWRRVSFACDAARGLAFLHSAGGSPALHLDFKPSNLLLSSAADGEVMPVAKVSDFGVAKLLGQKAAPASRVSAATHLTMTNVVGTYAYLDPEFADTHVASAASDVYSLGVVLVELLTGWEPLAAVAKMREHLADGESVATIVDKTADWPLPLAQEVLELANKCTKSKRALRPSMQEVVQKLTELLSTQPDSVCALSCKSL
eukprot:TRINITY_DN3155_c0_g1_i2.p1 TRINITY_DN3155_c0_g1~~TRINITY_DN3155_c0_g1_i2.p1  ORF type:complete len:480 (-),score=98.47 TRINITY_DN3155_c0_g1_i2:1255-2694(-)